MDEDSPYGIDIAGEETALVADEALFRDAIIRTLRRQGCPQAQISVALVNDAQIERLNNQYLQHDGPTDVLSFNLTDEKSDALEGELIICIDAAQREAAKRGLDTTAEVLLYAVHGTLHLLGLDDEKPDQAARMHAIEDEILTDMGLGRVYGAKVR